MSIGKGVKGTGVQVEGDEQTAGSKSGNSKLHLGAAPGSPRRRDGGGLCEHQVLALGSDLL